jgi:pyridoxine kinase
MNAVLPVLSAMGFSCCPAPTAVLSSHTGIEGYTFRDLTSDLDAFFDHWKRLKLSFLAIYSGFLGSAEQVTKVANAIDRLRDDDTLVLVDPVMGDNGRAYDTCTPELCGGMKALVKKAGVITPNLTEAAILLDEPIDKIPCDESAVSDRLYRLSGLGPPKIVITGLENRKNSLGVACFDKDAGTAEFIYYEKAGGYFPGTGDLFASVLLGYMLRGKSLGDSAGAAACFIAECAKYTAQQNTPPEEGVLFEKLLQRLISND